MLHADGAVVARVAVAGATFTVVSSTSSLIRRHLHRFDPRLFLSIMKPEMRDNVINVVLPDSLHKATKLAHLPRDIDVDDRHSNIDHALVLRIQLVVLFKGLEASDDQAPDMAHAHRELDSSHPGEPVSALLQGHDGDTDRVLVLGHRLESQDAANGILGVLVGRLDELCQGELGVWVFVEAGIQHKEEE